jgi:S-adenosylmethionine:tRNA ribosyltransferase-isomerase
MHPKELRIQDYTYALPDKRIAKYPLPQRDSSKLLVYNDGNITEDTYSHMASYIPSGALMVFNQTKVVNARLLFKKPSGGAIEVFCLAPHEQYADIQTAMQQKGSVLWECMIGGASKWKHGMVLELHNESPDFTVYAQIAERNPSAYIVKLDWSDASLTFAEVLHHVGKVPLPPYLHREAEASDSGTYQTMFAKEEGSVAAPTAGLHFTEHVMKGLAANLVDTSFVTLHVGAGTFKPVKAEVMEAHDMHAEWVDVSKTTVEQLLENFGNNPIIAVGTTSLRTLESLYWIGNKLAQNISINPHKVTVSQWEPYDTPHTVSAADALQSLLNYMAAQNIHSFVTRTQILIAPGYEFRIANGLVTNFHQPQSTLLLLVAALIGDDWKKVYDYAMGHGFRFLSYGDGSLLWRK